ncbi:Uncharacterized iron-regulated membrane protein [Pedobacter steynii]|uniref:Uncharacterized iron-regulated membrane protein n=1 Tax=Pedobacter steynii TaxID=430522 RepID=A0A1H0B7Q6_9SPHI|nr:PepSY-associated TM helix domain-containing protein [Pedobacter steynii]NQX41131.1 PepSY domain-containing protein [Pedobacter steynii]SDN41698.1 Uncharacterized iron-regulated membrane protein [Pedobacter steynii]
MKQFKNAVRQIHLWLGLGTGLVVFIISVTGCLYVFEEEIRDATQKEYKYVLVEQKPFVGLDQVIRNFEQLAPKEKITLIRITESEPNATVAVSTKKKRVYYFNPYDGQLVNKGGADWLSVVLDIHMTLLLGETGKFIQRWSVVIFVFMLLTGLVLWFPNQMRLLRQSLSIKWKGSFKRVNYDLHNVLGFYASGILIVVSLSGLYFAFKEVKTGVSFFTGSKLSEGRKEKDVPQKENHGPLAVRYNQMYQSILLQYPGVTSSSISVRKNGEIRLRTMYPYRWARNQNSFFFDETSGQLLRSKLYKDFNNADFYEATNYNLHTGQLFGWFGKIIACIASLISASLPVTGFVIWWKKRKKKKKPVVAKVRYDLSTTNISV